MGPHNIFSEHLNCCTLRLTQQQASSVIQFLSWGKGRPTLPERDCGNPAINLKLPYTCTRLNDIKMHCFTKLVPTYISMLSIKGGLHPVELLSQERRKQQFYQNLLRCPIPHPTVILHDMTKQRVHTSNAGIVLYLFFVLAKLIFSLGVVESYFHKKVKCTCQKNNLGCSFAWHLITSELPVQIISGKKACKSFCGGAPLWWGRHFVETFPKLFCKGHFLDANFLGQDFHGFSGLKIPLEVFKLSGLTIPQRKLVGTQLCTLFLSIRIK